MSHNWQLIFHKSKLCFADCLLQLGVAVLTMLRLVVVLAVCGFDFGIDIAVSLKSQLPNLLLQVLLIETTAHCQSVALSTPMALNISS